MKLNPDPLPRFLTLWLPVLLALAITFLVAFWPDAIRAWVTGELGVLENLEALALVVVLVMGGMTLMRPEVRTDARKLAWFGVFFLGIVYVLGEEISWGQHYFGWGTPEWYQAINDQQETNLHNTSTWLDQKPRALLELAIYFSSLVYPFLSRFWRIGWLERLPEWTWPSRACVVTALLTFISQLVDVSPLAKMASDVGLRLSEVREIYVYYFLFLYVYAFYRRPGAAAA